ncbi:hypothetical protein [Spirosoma endbachense]|uniref:Uncharacterized protein n=1 Tax=Spirosoma endbachense TaxID=2666025 RepID=A0A6P1W8R4_9BACT|nr:hypothetical protein [Spirosoma endbachense]QHW00959.1 hypothetical protein GJR95_40625 [Spirosoma endbachense]
MVTQQEGHELDRCRRLIEEKVGWGSGEGWATQDFERLSELIAGQTGVSLSVTTLKRVWGRVKYESAPTTTTLNALVQFAGYENWQQFKNTSQVQSIAPPVAIGIVASTIPKPVRRATRRHWWIGAGILIGLIGVSAFFLNYVRRKSLSPERFSFSSQPVTKGIPNSVVFHYDATASPTDQVFIQQSWDPNRRQPVPKNGHEYTSIYYHPGYFRAKLVIGDQIVREHNLMIPSDGWHIAVMQEPVPVYFQENDVIKNGMLSLSVAAIQQHNILMQPKPPTVRYRYVQELKNLRNDNFTLETRLKSDFKQGSSICQNVTIMILCKNEFFSIPLSAKGCVGNLDIYLAGHYADARNTDLSAFGADLSQWVDLRCLVRNKRAQVFIGGKKAYEALIPTEARDIIGISYDFEGTGSVDFTRFIQPNGQVVFEDNFDAPHKATSGAQVDKNLK